MILCTPRPINKRFLQNTFLFTVARDLCITLDLHFSTLIDCAAGGRGGASPIPNFVNLHFPTRATLTQYLFKSNAIRNSLGEKLGFGNQEITVGIDRDKVIIVIAHWLGLNGQAGGGKRCANIWTMLIFIHCTRRRKSRDKNKFLHISVIVQSF